MNILGIHDGHNATAALLQDGQLVASVSEERFSRQKNDIGYPYKAIDFVLKKAGISSRDIDRVYIATQDTDPILFKTKREAVFSVADYVNEMHSYWKPLLYENQTTDYWESLLKNPKFEQFNSYYDFSYIEREPKERWGELFNRERIRIVCEHLHIPEAKISFVDHHTAHAYYAYYASPHIADESAVIITADSWGDGCNATISKIHDGQIKEFYRSDMCHLARIYRWITLLLGMKPLEHEYKVMGLAPYAKDYLRTAAYNVFKETLVVDGLDFRWKEQPTDMYFYFKDKLEGIRFDGVAGGIQLWLEDILSEWFKNILSETGADTVYFSGGISMNIKANKTIAELPQLKRLQVPPSGGDESTAMGVAYYGHYCVQGNSPNYPLKHAYLGFEPSSEEAYDVANSFVKTNDKFSIITNADSRQIASLLKNGVVLGRCFGAMEFGARALGNRSILCDPSKPENLQKINEKIKFRDFWMPFTPSILFEHANDYLINPKELSAEYMTVAFDSTPLARQHLRAAIHPHDFTIRPQLVKKEINPEYYSIIDEFRKLTGIGAVLNTSLNLHGLPIVCNVEDAIHTLKYSDLDGLILPGLLLIKKEFIN